MSEIIRLQAADKDFELFSELPAALYPSGSLRFALPEDLNTDYLLAAYVLRANGRAKARAALYSNPHLQFAGQKCLCLGNYESADEPELAQRLLRHCCEEAKKLGAEYILGPMNGSTWNHYRFSLHHDSPGFFPEPYHHLYYNDHFKQAGFTGIARYFSSIDTIMRFDRPEVMERERELSAAGVRLRAIDLREYENELSRLFDFSLLAFRNNFLYTPVSRETFIRKYAETKKIIDPRFVLLAEDNNGNLIGYFFCLHNFFNTKEKQLVVKTIARNPDRKWKGLGQVMANSIYKAAVQEGYSSVIHAFMIEGGTSTPTSAAFSGTVFKNYMLYGKKIE